MSRFATVAPPLRRFKTREVMVGDVGIGGMNPVRIQSMTTSNTRDVEATIDQIMRLSDRGCEIARITVQGKKEAECCEAIKSGLLKRGYHIPIVADIHFYPPAALLAVEFVDKIRINPGNYADKRASFEVIDYSEASYEAELRRIEEEFSPLVLRCKELKKPMRIGTNHGSLSDRIMSRYGDTPFGMVESAFEFTRICRKLDFHDIIYSMKASNAKVMIEAYRLLVLRMLELGWDYPIHLGVTEAGEGEDGRIKSAVGIGALLLDGIGDTIRVSLTEDPWEEIGPCRELRALADRYPDSEGPLTLSKESDERREILCHSGVGLHPQGSVFLKVSEEEFLGPDFFSRIGCSQMLGRFQKGAKSPDAIVIDTLPEQAQGRIDRLKSASIPVYLTSEIQESSKDFFFASLQDPKLIHGRHLYNEVKESAKPIILHARYETEEFVIPAAAEMGALLVDGMGEGICLEAPVPIEMRLNFSFNLLQACRLRMSKTEYISCPGCGRTLFNLQQVTQKIKERTGHIPGLKIAVMGCIVNGPGEMADADVGYVGTRPGKIDLYVGKKCVKRGIEESVAVDELVALIQEIGLWIDK